MWGWEREGAVPLQQPRWQQQRGSCTGSPALLASAPPQEPLPPASRAAPARRRHVSHHRRRNSACGPRRRQQVRAAPGFARKSAPSQAQTPVWRSLRCRALCRRTAHTRPRRPARLPQDKVVPGAGHPGQDRRPAQQHLGCERGGLGQAGPRCRALLSMGVALGMRFVAPASQPSAPALCPLPLPQSPSASSLSTCSIATAAACCRCRCPSGAGSWPRCGPATGSVDSCPTRQLHQRHPILTSTLRCSAAAHPVVPPSLAPRRPCPTCSPATACWRSPSSSPQPAATVLTWREGSLQRAAAAATTWPRRQRRRRRRRGKRGRRAEQARPWRSGCRSACWRQLPLAQVRARAHVPHGVVCVALQHQPAVSQVSLQWRKRLLQVGVRCA